MSKSQSAFSALIAIAATGFLFGCAGLPSESSVARKYEAEHHGVKVLRVTKTTESMGPVAEARVDFHIDYQTSDGRVMHDTWTYGRVAEGWLRARQN